MMKIAASLLVVLAVVGSSQCAPQFSFGDTFRLLSDGFGRSSSTDSNVGGTNGNSGGLSDTIAALIASRIAGGDGGNNNNNNGNPSGFPTSLEDGLRLLASQGGRVAGVVRNTPDDVLDGVAGAVESASGSNTRLPRLNANSLGDLIEQGSRIIQDNPQLALSLITNLVNRNNQGN
ncbi:uncharacterized protein LOC131880828 [Tigriopus californicus]|uniref:uncharacterized protein LOC131880828 n=1 Tax=Tigriopus californicus TaxID=6832 RepID=UPI0027DAAC42|nr:uncharacterized protein LOC131880828 [Tigriopus californicus]